MDHLYKKLIFFIFISFNTLSIDQKFTDKVHFRIDQSYYSGLKINSMLKEAEYFNCLFPDTIISKTLNLKQWSNKKFDGSYSRNSKIFDWLNLLTFGANLKEKTGVKVYALVNERIKSKDCKLNIQDDAKKIALNYMKIEYFLAARFVNADNKDQESIQEFYTSLKTQYDFEEFL